MRSLTHSSQPSTSTVIPTSRVSLVFSIFPSPPRAALWASNVPLSRVSVVVLARATRSLSAAVVTNLCVLSLPVRLPPLTRPLLERADQRRLHPCRWQWAFGRSRSWYVRNVCICILYDLPAFCITTHIEHVVLYPIRSRLQIVEEGGAIVNISTASRPTCSDQKNVYNNLYWHTVAWWTWLSDQATDMITKSKNGGFH